MSSPFTLAFAREQFSMDERFIHEKPALYEKAKFYKLLENKVILI